MSYTKTTWRNNQAPAINADNLNHMEQGIESAHNQIGVNTSNIESLTTQVQNNATNIASEISARQTTDSSLQSQIDQLVAPTGEAPTPAEIENARIGDDGVTYDTLGNAIRGQFSDVKSDFKTNFQIDGNVVPTLISGKYINASNNSIADSENFSMTEPIAVKKGQIVKLTAKGYNANVGMIATCNADNSQRTTVVASDDSTLKTYTYKAETDGYIVCSFVSFNSTYKISLEIDYYEISQEVDALGISLPNAEDVNLQRNITGSYVDQNGEIQSSATFFISQSITLYKGQRLSLYARGYNQSVAMISEYDADTNTYSPLIMSIDSTNRTYEYTATKKIVVRCCAVFYSSGQSVPYSGMITTESTIIKSLDDYMETVEEDSLSVIEYPQLFANIICLGDSLTKGYNGNGDTVLVKNYPFYFKKLTQAEITNQSQGGITAKGFWDTFADDFDYTSFDCAVIFLGTNGGLTDTVETDCNVDYTQNADTNTGCYGKIIGRIKETAPNCKIFCVAGVNDYVRRATTMNPAVRALAEFYGVGLIDIENCIMSDGGGGGTVERYLYRPIDGIHYNALGYMTMANMMYDSMSAFMSENRTMYDDYNSN